MMTKPVLLGLGATCFVLWAVSIFGAYIAGERSGLTSELKVYYANLRLNVSPPEIDPHLYAFMQDRYCYLVQFIADDALRANLLNFTNRSQLDLGRLVIGKGGQSPEEVFRAYRDRVERLTHTWTPRANH